MLTHRTIVRLCAAAFSVVFLSGCGFDSPDLTPTGAAKIISRTPEFSVTRRLVSVKSAGRLSGSQSDCCAGAEFQFRETGASSPNRVLDAKADFQYWEGNWHLKEFQYGQPPDVTTVHIQSDLHKSLGKDGVP